MDMKEIGKLNELTRELQKHGLAGNAAESAAIANRIIVQGQVNIPPPNITSENTFSIESQSDNPSSGSRLSQDNLDYGKRYDILLQRLERNIYSELDNLKQQMNKISLALVSMKTDSSASNPVPIVQISQENPVSAQVAGSVIADERTSESDISRQSHSRKDLPGTPSYDITDTSRMIEGLKASDSRVQTDTERRGENRKQESHPKGGDINRQDVSVEKIFYFGVKK